MRGQVETDNELEWEREQKSEQKSEHRSGKERTSCVVGWFIDSFREMQNRPTRVEG